MISMSFINSGGRNELDRIDYECQLYLESVDDLIQDIFYDYKYKMNMVALESSIMDEVNEADTVYLEKEKKNIVEKIGSVIISIFEKVIKAIKNFQEWIKNFSFRNKSNGEKLDKLLNEHPELKDEIKESISRGEINLSDIRSLRELDAAYEEILRMSKDEKTDGKTLREKWKRAVKKFDEQNSAIVKAGKVAGGVTAIIGAGLAVYTLKQKIKESKLNGTESERSLQKLQRETYKTLKEQGIITDDMGKYESLTAIARECNGCHSAAAKQDATAIQRLQNFVDRCLDSATNKLKKINGDQNAAFHRNMEYNLARDAEDEANEYQKKLREVRDTEVVRQNVRREQQEAHAAEDARRDAVRAARNTRAQLGTRYEFNNTHRNNRRNNN